MKNPYPSVIVVAVISFWNQKSRRQFEKMLEIDYEINIYIIFSRLHFSNIVLEVIQELIVI